MTSVFRFLGFVGCIVFGSCAATADEGEFLLAVDDRVKQVAWYDVFPEAPAPSNATWILATPTGSQAFLETGRGLTTSFIPDLPGTYSIECDADFGAAHSVGRLRYLVMDDGAMAEILIDDISGLVVFAAAQPTNFTTEGELRFQWYLDSPPGSQADIHGETTRMIQLDPFGRGPFRLYVELTDDIHSAEAEVVLDI